MDREEIEKRLEGKPKKQIVIFAARCALRALSYLPIKDGKISGWQKDKAGLHVFSVFRAVNASLFLAESLSSSKEIFVAKAVAKAALFLAESLSSSKEIFVAKAAAKADATVAAYAAAEAAAAAYYDDAAYDVAKAAVKAADAAEAATKADVYAATKAAADAAVAFLFKISHQKDIEKDLSRIDELSLTDPLGGVAKERINLIANALRSMGLGYWAEEYTAWCKGELNWQKMQHCFDMSKEHQGSLEAMLGWLNSYGNTSNLDEARVLVIGDGAVGKTSLLERLHHNTFDDKQSTTSG